MRSRDDFRPALTRYPYLLARTDSQVVCYDGNALG
jgi:hypothetical protein